MLAALKALSFKTWGFILAGVAIAAALLKAYSAGRTAERAATNEKNLDAKNEQLKAATRRPRDRGQLIDRLRNGRF